MYPDARYICNMNMGSTEILNNLTILKGRKSA